MAPLASTTATAIDTSTATSNATAIQGQVITIGNRQFVRDGIDAIPEEAQITIGVLAGAFLFLALYFSLVKLHCMWEAWREKVHKQQEKKGLDSTGVELQDAQHGNQN